jgi:hypothetical protein
VYNVSKRHCDPALDSSQRANHRTRQVLSTTKSQHSGTMCAEAEVKPLYLIRLNSQLTLEAVWWSTDHTYKVRRVEHSKMMILAAHLPNVRTQSQMNSSFLSRLRVIFASKLSPISTTPTRLGHGVRSISDSRLTFHLISPLQLVALACEMRKVFGMVCKR